MINYYRQRGFSAIIAIVLVVVFALIGGYLATFLTTSALNTAASSNEIRAWFAARSGIEWTVHNALNNQPPACVPATCGVNCCLVSTAPGGTFPIGAANAIDLTGPGLDGYEFYLNSCTAEQATEGGVDYCIYNIDLTARSGTEGEFDYSLRNMVISFTDRNAP
jgi:Tfp pilus assembly protein PilX